MIQQFSTYVISYRLFTFFTCLSSQKQSKVCNLCLIIVIYIYNQNNVGYKAFKITQLPKKSINTFYVPISFCLFPCCIINILLKVRQSRNDFFKLTFLPKTEQMNSTLLLYDTSGRLVFVRFLEEIEDTKKTFQN